MKLECAPNDVKAGDGTIWLMSLDILRPQTPPRPPGMSSCHVSAMAHTKQVNEWEVSGPPDDVKSALAEKKFGPKIKDTIKELQKTMGVQIFVMAGYQRPNGEVIKVQ
jgi:hypothetical protein